MIAQSHFSFHFISVRNGYIVHLVPKANDPHVMCIGPGCGNTHPDSDLCLCLLILPVACYHFPVFTHSGYHMSEFPVSVSTLVQVHKVHINFIPGDLFVELCMEMQQRLVKCLQPVDPHLGRGESMHPGDHPNAFFVIVCLPEGCRHLFFRVHGSFINDFYGKVS